MFFIIMITWEFILIFFNEPITKKKFTPNLYEFMKPGKYET
jgi:hypothetical protein